ncbi:uncharacterized protein LOC130782829 isoform X2 [Actinidia eriantha]|uniref:uncharacterized protein LOC130782829 isoform X2 n=1 Tax=Actinidia eriantha TaxID=165200 RepID=UPI002589B002|nr:uncharacterized protein LOC130782829 isoform X2 [Actinidia eriantha]
MPKTPTFNLLSHSFSDHHSNIKVLSLHPSSLCCLLPFEFRVLCVFCICCPPSFCSLFLDSLSSNVKICHRTNRICRCHTLTATQASHSGIAVRWFGDHLALIKIARLGNSLGRLFVQKKFGRFSTSSNGAASVLWYYLFSTIFNREIEFKET